MMLNPVFFEGGERRVLESIFSVFSGCCLKICSCQDYLQRHSVNSFLKISFLRERLSEGFRMDVKNP